MNKSKLAPWLILAVGLGVYHNSFTGPFIFDDFRSIVDNPHIRQLWPPWKPLENASRPLVQWTLALNYAISGLEVWSYHTLNLIIHLGAALTLFGLIRRTLLSKPLRVRWGDHALGIALTTALLWVAHPLQTQSVTYIIQRGESLMGLFYLLTLYCLARSTDSAKPREWLTLGVATCLWGMTTKPVMLTAPLIVCLFDRMFLAHSWQQVWERRRGFYIALAGTWLILGRLAWTYPHEESVGFSLARVTAWDYALTQCEVILHYLRLSFWPHPLVLDYADWPVTKFLWHVFPQAIAICLLLGATVWAVRRWLPLGFLGAWFFLILAPTSSFLPISDVAFEHRMYLPLAAVLVLTVLGCYAAFQFLHRKLQCAQTCYRVCAATTITTAVLALGALTLRRNEDYRSGLAIWSDTVAKRPANFRAHNNLAAALLQQGKLDEALIHFEEALRLHPNYFPATYGIAFILTEQGKPQEAIARCLQQTFLHTENPIPRYYLAKIMLKQGKLDAAIDHFKKALALNPNYDEAKTDLHRAELHRAQRDKSALP